MHGSEGYCGRRCRRPRCLDVRVKDEAIVQIPEVEVSVTASCSLACRHCGFAVPDQPRPFLIDPVRELESALRRLDALDFEIGSLALLGGEAMLAPRSLEAMLGVAAAAGCVRRVELVTNGLTPKGLSLRALGFVKRLSLSDYTSDGALAEAWRAWLASRAPHLEFVVRRHASWDRWADVVDLGEAGGQAAYDQCWYRRHCVTLERGRIFVCSRIPKLALDEQGLVLDDQTTRADVIEYLSAPMAPAACRTCTPMADLPPVKPGEQPDDRLVDLRRRALEWFASQEVVR